MSDESANSTPPLRLKTDRRVSCTCRPAAERPSTATMCNSKPYPPPSTPVVENTGESGGLHVEGVHQISLVLSSGAVIAIIVMVAVWCLLRRRDRCCKMNGGENTAVQIAIPSAPPTMSTMPPPCTTLPMATLSPTGYMNQAHPSDIELALFRMQEKERQRHFNHLQLLQQQKEEMQRREETQYPVV